MSPRLEQRAGQAPRRPPHYSMLEELLAILEQEVEAGFLRPWAAVEYFLMLLEVAHRQ